MSTAMLLSLLSPLLLLVAMIGVVAVVALVKAESNDVPEVARVFCSIFRWLVARVPGAELPLSGPRDQTWGGTCGAPDELPSSTSATEPSLGTDGVDVAHTVLAEMTEEDA